MNDPAANPVNIEEQRAWLIDHRAKTGSSWSELARRMNYPQGTLSQFGSERGYSGNEQPPADAVYRYRQLLIAQAARAVEAPTVPGFFRTPTSDDLMTLLHIAQDGEIVVGALGAGLSKTTTAKHFKACYPNVFHATMKPSTAGVMNMLIEILKGMGEPNAIGTPQKLAAKICDKLRDKSNAVIILDEAQHLTEKALDEARSIADETGCGLALFGNIEIMQRIEGGNRKASFAQLFSRIGMRLIRPVALQADADALAAAWAIGGGHEIAQIRKVCALPGGLRGATHMLKLATRIAAAEQTQLAVDHLQDAWAQLSTQAVAA